MAGQLLSKLKTGITGLELQPSGGGCFELTVNDKLVYSKLETGEFPNESDLVAQVEALA